MEIEWKEKFVNKTILNGKFLNEHIILAENQEAITYADIYRTMKVYYPDLVFDLQFQQLRHRHSVKSIRGGYTTMLRYREFQALLTDQGGKQHKFETCQADVSRALDNLFRQFLRHLKKLTV